MAAHAALAAAELGLGHATEALTAAQATLALAPADPTARFVLASLALDRHDGTEAETQLAELRRAGVDGYELEILAAGAPPAPIIARRCASSALTPAQATDQASRDASRSARKCAELRRVSQYCSITVLRKPSYEA